MKWLGIGIVLGVVIGSGAGCSSSSDSSGSGGSATGGSAGSASADCQAIMDACMPKDDGTPGNLHDCHMVAHDGNAAKCSSQKATCVPLCEAAPVLDGGMGGMGGMAGMGG